MTVDGQLVARTVAELRAMPKAEDLLARLGRVVEVTRTVVGVDGTGLTLVHDDGPPRWVATTDAAMQLLEEVQHDFGEGPCLAAFAEDRVVAVQDLRTELVWDRIAVVVRQLQVRGVLSVPVRLADQPVGTLNEGVRDARVMRGLGAASGQGRSARQRHGRRPGPGTAAPASGAAPRRWPGGRSPAPPAPAALPAPGCRPAAHR
jgi:hypothetical protein